MDGLQKITKDKNGVYYWYGTVDAGYEKKTFGIAFGVCGGICLFFIMASLSLGADMLGVTLLSCLGVMAVCGGVCWVFNLNAGNRRQGYRMSETHITFVGGRRSTVPFSFKSIRRAVIFPSRHMIELYPLVGSGPVFAPPEDYGFVRDFILERIPREAEVVTEN